VDHGAAFEGLLPAMDAISTDLPLVFPVHPRRGEVVRRRVLQTARRGSR
jgi:hypothetical protein